MAQSRSFQQAFVVILVVAVSLGLFALMMAFKKSPEKQAKKLSVQPVSVQPVVFGKKVIDVPTRGVVRARVTLPLMSEVSGKVIEVSPKWQNGGFFEKGELILQIEDDRYRLDVANAESNLAQAESQLIQEQGIAYVAKKDWEGLLNGENQAAEKLALRKPQLASAKAQVASAKAALVVARLNLSKTKVRAPFDGLISDKSVDIEQFVQGNQAMGVMHAVDRVEIRVPVTATQIPLLSLPKIGKASDMAVQLLIRHNGTVDTWKGTLVRTEALLNEEDGVLYGVVEVTDPYGLKSRSASAPLRIGAFVEVILPSRPLEKVVKLPRRLLSAGNHVWMVDGDNQLEKRKVDILPTRGESVYVIAGLEAGELVVMSPIPDPVEGRQVEVQPFSAENQRLAGKQP